MMTKSVKIVIPILMFMSAKLNGCQQHNERSEFCKGIISYINPDF